MFRLRFVSAVPLQFVRFASRKPSSRADMVYLKEKYSSTESLPGESPLQKTLRIRRAYKLLSASEKASYEKVALSNKAAQADEPKKKTKKKSASPAAVYASEVLKSTVSLPGELPLQKYRRVFAEFKLLSDDKKAEYESKALERKQVDSGDNAGSKKRRAPSRYALFFKDQYASAAAECEQAGKKSVGNIARVIAERWKNLSADKKSQ